MLMQAYEMRALIVLIDGVDEAAGLRDEIEDFIHRELVPSGHRRHRLSYFLPPTASPTSYQPVSYLLLPTIRRRQPRACHLTSRGCDPLAIHRTFRHHEPE